MQILINTFFNHATFEQIVTNTKLCQLLTKFQKLLHGEWGWIKLGIEIQHLSQLLKYSCNPHLDNLITQRRMWMESSSSL